MKNLLKDWNLRRTIYLVGGLWMLVQTIMDKMWIFIPFSIYFIAMAIFKWGCASGNCTLEQKEEK